MTNTVRLADPVHEDFSDLSPNAFDPYEPPPQPCLLCGGTGKVTIKIDLPDDDRMVQDWRKYGIEEGYEQRPRQEVVYECWKCQADGLPRVIETRKQRWWDAS